MLSESGQFLSSFPKSQIELSAFVFRDLKVANDKLEDLQSQFAEIDQQDVKQRSDFKNAKESIPKLMKSVEDLKRKVKQRTCMSASDSNFKFFYSMIFYGIAFL